MGQDSNIKDARPHDKVTAAAMIHDLAFRLNFLLRHVADELGLRVDVELLDTTVLGGEQPTKYIQIRVYEEIEYDR